MGNRLVWADLGPYQAVLYEVDDFRPFNKKVATVEYDHHEHTYMVKTYDRPDALQTIITELVMDIPTKVEAMEQAMAELVIQRMNKADKTN